jgi:tetratricopeptide (TPR) repeat protein
LIFSLVSFTRKKDIYDRVLDFWKKELASLAAANDMDDNVSVFSVSSGGGDAGMMPPGGSQRGSIGSFNRVGSLKNLSFGASRRNAISNAISGSMLNVLNASMAQPSVGSLERATSSASLGGRSVASVDDVKDSLYRVVTICAECFKFSNAKNRELYLRMVILGWTNARSLLEDDSPQTQAALELQLGFAHLEGMKFAKSKMDFSDERACVKAFRRCIELLAAESAEEVAFVTQRRAAYYGLAQAYRTREEGDHVGNLLKSVTHLQSSIRLFSSKENPGDCIMLYHEIGDLYIEAGVADSANEFLNIALEHLHNNHEPGSLSWTTISEIKFLRAKTECKLAQACVVANKNLDPEHDPLFLENAEKGIAHYETALEVFALHLYPLEYARTSVQLCHLRAAAGSNSVFSANGIVCLYQGQRSKLLKAYEGFQDALTVTETLAIVMLIANETSTVSSPVDDEICILLTQCFSGCIQTSIRLGMYAQALSYTERARGYAISKHLLREPCRTELLKGLPAPLLNNFRELARKLTRHYKHFQLEGVSHGNYSGMLQDGVQMVKMLNDMAAHADICSNAKLRLLGVTAPKAKDDPCVWLEDPVQDCETALLQFYVSDKCAYAFIKCWKEDCPRTIEYTLQQMKEINTSVQNVYLPDSEDQGRSFMRCLEVLSEALKIDTVLRAVPPGVRRLVIVPHGPLMTIPLHLLPLDKSTDVFYKQPVCVPSRPAVTQEDDTSWLHDELLMDR